MRNFNKLILLTVAGAMAFTLSACNKTPNVGVSTDSAHHASGLDIGIALPQKTSENWLEADEYFKEFCKEHVLKCKVVFADEGTAQQQKQLSNFVSRGVKILVVGAVDGSALGVQLQKAKDAGIQVIAYDRLLMNTPDVDYYVSYDNFKVGVKQGKALVEGLEKRKPGGSWNIEVFAGSSDDSNSGKFFDGAMSVLQPLIDSGKLKIVSGQNTQEQVATKGWKPENAAARMNALLAQYYPQAGPDGILSPNDALGRAILKSCQQAGKSNPVITGQDSEIDSLKLIMQGKQYATISKPTKPMVDTVGFLAVKLLNGAKDLKDINRIAVDDKQYNNGKKVVPAFLLTAVVATKENARGVYNDEPKKLEALNSVK